MQPFAALLPLGISLVGSSGLLFAQSLDGANTSTGTVFSGSILAAAVGALVWVTKQFANGRLVARDPDTVESQLIELVKSTNDLATKSLEREKELMALIRSGQGRPFDPERRQP